MKNIIKTDGNYSRPGIRVNCLQCGHRFTTYAAPSKRAKFCSHECAHVYKTKELVKLECAQCKNVFFRRSSAIGDSKSGLRFCSKKCKGRAQRIGGIKEIMPPHYGTSSLEYRGRFDPAELICSRCGYKEFNCSVEIHHKDKNRQNNAKENLIPLCANCHRAFHNNLWL